jgi:2-keto-4-pentenoate hydratase
MPIDDLGAARAAQILLDHWKTVRTLSTLPPDCCPASRAEGYAIQRQMLSLSGRRAYGWKIAATSTAGQAHIGVDGPLAGHIHGTQVLPLGSDIPIADSLMKVAEVEFAFRMGRTLSPRTAPYTQSEVMSAVATLHPAIEIPDSRFQDFARVGAAHLVADNACADRFMLGLASPADWRDLNLAEFQVEVSVSGQERVIGLGSNVLGDPRTALTWLVNELSQYGMSLDEGQVVTTGTCAIPIPVKPGIRIAADFKTLGSIEANFV